MAAAHRLGEQPADRARVGEPGDRVRQRAGHRGDGQARHLFRLRHGLRTDEPGAAGGPQPPGTRHEDVDPVEGGQRRGGAEPVQRERRQAGDHRLAAAASAAFTRAGGVLQCAVQPLLAGGRPRVQQEHPRQHLLPGPSGPALLGGVGGGHALLAQLSGGQHAPTHIGEVAQRGRGDRGVLWFMPRQFPR